MINRYTVIGQPIAHSLSPPIHELFGELTQRRVRYTRTEATPDTFVDTVRVWQAEGGRGCNVTVPFKGLALEACDRLSRAAERAGSVNTIHMHRDGCRVGHSTDGPGLVIDIERNLRRPLGGRRVLLLGAGGAARAVVESLLAARPAKLHVANRTASRARELVERFAGAGISDVPLDGSGHDDLERLGAFDVVVNATSASLGGSLPPLPESLLAPDALAYDMVYAANDTVFTAWARARGASVADGFGMLVEQAAEAFSIWEGARPKTRMVWPRLRAIKDAAGGFEASANDDLARPPVAPAASARRAGE